MANDITFIIGNGLDLRLGLKTSYKDFYNHASTHNLHPGNKIYKAIKEDPETWADFEIRLGRYTDYIESEPEEHREQASIKFHDELEEVLQDLGDYLETQSDLIEATRGVSIGREDFFEELPSGPRNKILSSMPGGLLTLNFVTLNYTNTLEKILPHRNVSIVPANIRIENIHHIHGDLTENMTLGVSEEAQLYEGMSAIEKDDLIKPRSIASSNDDRIEQMKRIINGSSIVVLFGTSIGESDKYIWASIAEWLSLNPLRHVVIHKHDTAYTNKTKRSPRRQKLFMNEVQERLLGNSSLDDSVKKSLKSRIFVVHNTKKLFAKN